MESQSFATFAKNLLKDNDSCGLYFQYLQRCLLHFKEQASPIGAVDLIDDESFALMSNMKVFARNFVIMSVELAVPIVDEQTIIKQLYQPPSDAQVNKGIDAFLQDAGVFAGLSPQEVREGLIQKIYDCKVEDLSKDAKIALLRLSTCSIALSDYSPELRKDVNPVSQLPYTPMTALLIVPSPKAQEEEEKYPFLHVALCCHKKAEGLTQSPYTFQLYSPRAYKKKDGTTVLTMNALNMTSYPKWSSYQSSNPNVKQLINVFSGVEQGLVFPPTFDDLQDKYKKGYLKAVLERMIQFVNDHDLLAFDYLTELPKQLAARLILEAASNRQATVVISQSESQKVEAYEATLVKRLSGKYGAVGGQKRAAPSSVEELEADAVVKKAAFKAATEILDAIGK